MNTRINTAAASAADMTEGCILSKMIWFMIPVFFGNLVQQIYGLVDSVIVGRSMGSNALAAIGATDSLTYLVIGCANGITAGFAVCTAQAKGSRDSKRLGAYTIWITRLCLMISVPVGIIMVLSSPGILRMLNTPEELLPLSSLYLLVIFTGLPITMCLNALLAVLRSVGDSRICFYLLLLSTGANIILDLLLVAIWHLGTTGAAAATISAQLLALLAGILYTVKKQADIRFVGATGDSALNERPRELAGQGLPMGFQVIITAVATMIIQSALNHFGTDCIAAFTIGTKIQNILTQLFHAFGMTVAAFVGQNTGKGDLRRIRQGMHSALAIGIVCAIFCIGIVLLFLDAGITFFGDDVNTHIREYCHHFMNCCIIGYIPLAFLFVFRSSLQAMGESRVTLIGGLCELAARALVVAAAAPTFGFYGICLGHTAAWTMALIPLMIIYYAKKSPLLCLGTVRNIDFDREQPERFQIQERDEF